MGKVHPLSTDWQGREDDYNTRVSWRGTVALATVLAGWPGPGGPTRADPPGGGGPGGGALQPPLELIGGKVHNVSDSCGRPRTLTVQFLGPVSPRLEVPPGASEPVSLTRGLYQATVQTSDGLPLESPLVVVERKDFVWSFGCPPFADPPVTSPVQARSKSDGVISVRFANTTPDCGEPRAVVFVLNGEAVATVPAGKTVQARAPTGDLLLEVVSIPQNQRLFIHRLGPVEADQTLWYGCTDPGFVSRKDGVVVVFENATDSCPSPAPLTLWVDGWPRVGLLPGRALTLALPRGPHEFEVRPGLQPARLLQGTRDVQAPFRIRYGCSKQD